MPWKSQKLLLIGLGFTLSLFLVFLLGIAFGASSEADEFRLLVLPILSTVGNWLAGIGALGAVVVALWLAEQQRRKEKESINIEFAFVTAPWILKPVLCVSVVAVGNRPSNIHSIVLVSPGAGTQLLVKQFHEGSAELPKLLGYGEKAIYLFTEGFEKHIASYIKTYAHGSADKLQVVVSTTTENFVLKPDESIKQELERLAKDAAEAPLKQPASG